MLDCLMIKLCCFIQFAFDRVALVSQPGRKFGMLTWLGSDYYFFFIVNLFCWFIFLVIAIFYFMLSKSYNLIKLNQVNDLDLIFFLKHLRLLSIFFKVKNIWVGLQWSASNLSSFN